MALVLVGQTELWDQKLRMQGYAAITQRIDMNIVLNHMDRSETGNYITAHLSYAGCTEDIFTPGAEDEIAEYRSFISATLAWAVEIRLRAG